MASNAPTERNRTRERVVVEVPDDLRDAARERGWPEGLLERALEVGIPARDVRGWLHWRTGSAEDTERRIHWHERLTFGDLRGREASASDNDAFCDLWASSPERLGPLEITTLRGPNGFAQFQLQDNVNLHVIADGNVLVACCGWARRNVLVAGRRMSVRYGQALRVHRDYRRQGFGDAVRSFSGGMNTGRPSTVQYDIMRSGNFAVVDWWKKYSPDFFDNTPAQEGEVPGIPVTVSQLAARPSSGAGPRLRRARREDVAACASLINRTHAGQDLFRPCSPERLEDRLDEDYWGERAEWFPAIYGWSDYHVIESEGRIVACAGAWDRGRDQRDRIRHVESGQERIVSELMLLDWGYETGAEDAMVELIDHFVGRAHALGRTFLVAPLDHQPELSKRLESFESTPETRYLRWDLSDPALTRPHTDLRYW